MRADVARAETVTAPPEPAPVRKGLKPIAWWVEAIKRVGATSPSIAPFMRVARAYENGDKILIRVDGAMAKTMLDTPQLKATLSAISATLGASQVAAEKFEFVETGDTATELTPIDELEDI